MLTGTGAAALVRGRVSADSCRRAGGVSVSQLAARRRSSWGCRELPDRPVAGLHDGGRHVLRLRRTGSTHVILAPLCVLAVPLYDFCSVVLIRLSQGRSPFHADKSPLFAPSRRDGNEPRPGGDDDPPDHPDDRPGGAAAVSGRGLAGGDSGDVAGRLPPGGDRDPRNGGAPARKERTARMKPAPHARAAQPRRRETRAGRAGSIAWRRRCWQRSSFAGC